MEYPTCITDTDSWKRPITSIQTNINCEENTKKMKMQMWLEIKKTVNQIEKMAKSS